MLKHLGEELVPFTPSGFAREPERPLAGEPVTVRCRVDFTGETPVLLLRAHGAERTLAPDTGDGRFYAFRLGAFETGDTVEYQIKAGEEATPWFRFAVDSVETIEKPLALYRRGDAVVVALAADVCLTVTGGETLTMSLAQQAAQGAPAEGATLMLPQNFTFVAGRDFIWQLNRLSDAICTCLGYTLRRDPAGRVTSVAMRMRMAASHVLGTGERFEAVDMHGHATNGRVVEKFTHQETDTYLPIPFFMTEQGFGWYRAGTIPAAMRFGEVTELEQETEGTLLTVDEITFGKPADLLSRFIARTGKPTLPPEWAFGLWISAHGWNTDAEVDAQLAALKRFNYPATVMVLEQWSDERTFYRWHDTNWRDPAAMVRRVREAGLHLVLWQIPVVKYEWDGEAGEQLLADEREAIEKGYVIKAADGSPYRVTERWFHHSLMPDFTNPAAVQWWFGKRKHLLDMGVEGFKTDGGEFLFDKSARLFDGTSGLAAHNLYSGQFIGAYHDFFEREGVQGVTFSRSDFVGAQSRPIHWAGDQMSEWGELQACLNAGLSAGLSGILYWSFDIGGFAGPIPSAELYLRATAMGCFCPVMQWHAEPRAGQFDAGKGELYNNERSPWNLAEKHHDETILAIACDFAHIREGLRPYLWQEARHSAETGRPMMAHLCLDWPDDPRCFSVSDQYMLGRELLVAPLTREGEDTRDVYLPAGSWEDYFTGELLGGGRTVRVTCPLDRIPVYRRR